jgi:glyoxylase-like metal-dependent hydrolase (beta-lactamase superfamily II)
MRTMLIRCSATVLLGGGLWVAYTQAPQPAKLDVVKVAEDLYVIHNDLVPGNTTALITNEGVLLVDDKFAQDANNIVAEVKKLTSQPIKYVINTHHHGDHTGGNPTMQQLGALVVPRNKPARTWWTGACRVFLTQPSRTRRISTWAVKE